MRLHGERGGGSRFLYEPFEKSGGQEVKEFNHLLENMIPPTEIRQKFLELDALIEERRRRVWLFNTIKTVAGWAMVVSAGWVAFRGVISELIVGIQQ